MKSGAAALAMVFPLLVWGCSDADHHVMQPTPVPTFRSATALFAQLDGPRALPVGLAAQGTPSGTMSMMLNVGLDDSGSIVSATAEFQGTFSGFPEGSSLMSAHVNKGAAGTLGPPVIDLGLVKGQVTFVSGFGSLNVTVAVAPAIAAEILANPSGFYCQADTAFSTSGALRGQFVIVAVAPIAVPARANTSENEFSESRR